MSTAYAPAVALFEDYIDGPARYWPPDSRSQVHRQHRKLQHWLQVAAGGGESQSDVVERTISLARERAVDRPPPIYVLGLGGSGSHWLAGMIATASGAKHLTEVYIPGRLATEMEELPGAEQGFLVDCLHIVHALRREVSIATRFVNPAGGRPLRIHKVSDPRCLLIQMMRDPRDQVMSVTFRKKRYRELQDPSAADEQYLIDRALRNRSHHALLRRSSVQPDLYCRYEDLQHSAEETLTRILATIGEEVDDTRVRKAVGEHDANLMRQGRIARKGNLSPTASQGWREEADRRQRAVLHAHLVEAVTSARYPADDCLGAPLAMPAQRAARTLAFPADVSAGTILLGNGGNDAGGSWSYHAQARGEVMVPPRRCVKLRLEEASGRSIVEAVCEGLPSDGLDSLCLAGNAAVDDGLLESIASSMSGLRELDLARTGVSNVGLSALRNLPQLEGLSAIGTGVSAQALLRLGEELPSLTVTIA